MPILRQAPCERPKINKRHHPCLDSYNLRGKGRNTFEQDLEEIKEVRLQEKAISGELNSVYPTPRKLFCWPQDFQKVSNGDENKTGDRNEEAEV